jgi:hypothetical protein
MFPNNPKVSLEIRQRAPPGSKYEAYNPDSELDKPYCYQAKGMQDIKANDDCIKSVLSQSHVASVCLAPTD